MREHERVGGNRLFGGRAGIVHSIGYLSCSFFFYYYDSSQRLATEQLHHIAPSPPTNLYGKSLFEARHLHNPFDVDRAHGGRPYGVVVIDVDVAMPPATTADMSTRLHACSRATRRFVWDLTSLLLLLQSPHGSMCGEPVRDALGCLSLEARAPG